MNLDLEMITYDLECAIDNLAAVHLKMEEDGGANWQRMCNAIFSIYRQLCNIHADFNKMVDK